MKLGFGQIENALRQVHGVLPEWHSAFRARLRYLQRADYGIPRAGSGRKANFSVGHALLFELGIELQHFGLTPTHVAELIGENRAELLTAIRKVCEDPASSDGTVLFFYPNALSFHGMPKEEQDRLEITVLVHGSADDFGVLEGPQAPLRAAFLNLTQIIIELTKALAGEGAETAPYYAALEAWVAEGAN